ncbi:very short patch repair endonuclease [Solidesulfovibrio sp.]
MPTRYPWQQRGRRVCSIPMDTMSVAQRSRIMARVKGRDTRPEKALRSLLFRHGFRFRLHQASLPGKPDIVLPRYKTVIFVHGCFWHRHAGCKRASMPASHAAYWERKFQRNVSRDAANKAKLEQMGWRVLIVWECELRTLEDHIDALATAIGRLPAA